MKYNTKFLGDVISVVKCNHCKSMSKTFHYCCWVLNVAFNNFSVISRWCLVATGSCVHFYSAASLKYHAPDTWHDITSQSYYPDTGSTSPSSECQAIFNDFCMSRPWSNPRPPISQSGHSTYWAIEASHYYFLLQHIAFFQEKLLILKKLNLIQLHKKLLTSNLKTFCIFSQLQQIALFDEKWKLTESNDKHQVFLLFQVTDYF